MLKVRELYENVFHEIEGEDSDVRVAWPNDTHSLAQPLAYPRFLTRKEFEQRHMTEKPGEKSILKSMKNNQLITKSSIMKFVPGEESGGHTLKTEQVTEPNLKTDPNNLSQIKSIFTASSSDDREKLDALEQVDFQSMAKTDLINIRENLSLEVLWIQQAIQSRIQVGISWILF
jgi:hypothetical protein